MSIVAVTRLDDPRLADYQDIKDAEWVKRRGVFIVESPLSVLRFAEGSNFRLRSAFVSERMSELITQLAERVRPEVPIYTADPALMREVVGFDLHRGCLAAGEVGEVVSLERSLERESPRLVVVAEALSNVDNVGSLFRNAAAFGVGLVVVDAGCVDPLYRRSIRVSVGLTLTLPFARVQRAPDALSILRERRYLCVALSPMSSALPLAEVVERMANAPKVALFVGTEGDGLGEAVLGGADLRVRIPMAAGMDSLNVATATAVALYRIEEERGRRRGPTEN